MVIPLQFDLASEFTNGLACVRVGEQFGFIDETGKFVIKPHYEWAEPFSEGIAPVTTEHSFGYINKSEKYIWKSSH